jgi:hypothetical protein
LYNGGRFVWIAIHSIQTKINKQTNKQTNARMVGCTMQAAATWLPQSNKRGREGNALVEPLHVKLRMH